ncbi:MAG: hypothetical protein WC789_06915 [Lentisphaeria bacterium]
MNMAKTPRARSMRLLQKREKRRVRDKEARRKSRLFRNRAFR